MTDIEYKEQSERVEKYNKCADKVSVIEEKKSAIQNGILSIQCSRDKQIDFDYLGDNFKQRLIENIVSFLDEEIENIKKEMEKI